jgi:hypothetical protein
MSEGCCFPNARQCTATSKRTHRRCRGPAVTGWTVCRFHGAGGGAPKGEANGAYRHGLHTNEAKAERAYLRELMRNCAKTVNQIGDA